MTPASENMRGAALMCACMAGYGINDALIKLASAEAGLGQALLLRGLVATALLALLCGQRGGFRVSVPIADRKLMAWRIFGELGGTFCFLQALFNMPIANATAILQSLPLAVALAGSWFLGERVGWRRYSAILAGFGGVLLIIRPGVAGFDATSFWALGAVCFIVQRDLLTRRLSAAVPSVLVAVITAGCIALMGLALTPLDPWQPVSLRMMLLLGGAAVFLVAGYLFSVSAMRVGDIGFVSPFRYTILLWAIILGIVIFEHVPDHLTFVGAGIVVAAGVYTFYRERRTSMGRG